MKTRSAAKSRNTTPEAAPRQASRTAHPPLTVLLAAPRGFCAGVERAIQAVQDALEQFGPPVYVRHEIVHNKRVVGQLAEQGAIFVEEISDIPPGMPVVTSAHGVAQKVARDAARAGAPHIDATCPLVEKVHREVQKHAALGRVVILIGHRGHPEVEGTLGQAPEGAVLLVETLRDAERLQPPPGKPLAWATQTTLSVQDTAQILERIRARFPEIAGPRRDDICYATTNRQNAVAAIAPECDLFLVIGSENSSNSKRLVEVARNAGCAHARLIENANDLPQAPLARRDGQAVRKLGLTAGASAPESLVQEVIQALRRNHRVQVRERPWGQPETVQFAPPRALKARNAPQPKTP